MVRGTVSAKTWGIESDWSRTVGCRYAERRSKLGERYVEGLGRVAQMEHRIAAERGNHVRDACRRDVSLVKDPSC